MCARSGASEASGTECAQNKTEIAALEAATGNRKGAVAPLQCQGVWGRNAPSAWNEPLRKAKEEREQLVRERLEAEKALEEARRHREQVFWIGIGFHWCCYE